MILARKKITKFALLILLTLALPIINYAQPPDPGDGNGGGGDPEAPIDGGVSLILAAGAAAGARKIYKLNKEKNVEK